LFLMLFFRLVKNEIRELEIEASEVLGMLETAKREAKIAKETDREVDRELKAAQNEVNSLETSFKGLEDTIAQGPDLASYVSYSLLSYSLRLALS